MTELVLAKKDVFGENEVNIYRNEQNEVFMTIEQLAQVLEYSSRKSVEKIIERNEYLKNNEFSVVDKLSATDGKVYNTRLLTEDGIYEITMLSRQPKAQEFRFFIRELLKGLRKGELEIRATPQNYIEALRALADAEEEKQKLSQEVVGLNQTIGLMQPKMEYLDTILNSTDTLNITQIAKDYGLSGRTLNTILHEEGIQYTVGRQWLLYQQHVGKGYTKTHTHVYSKGNGDTGTSLQTKWTQKGRLLIHDILTKLGYKAEMDKEQESVEFN